MAAPADTEQMGYHWVSLLPKAERLPVFLTRTILDLQAELLKRQQALAERVGEPVLMGIWLVYDNWFDVGIGTFPHEVILLAADLHDGLSGPKQEASFNDQAQAFAFFAGVPHCLPTQSLLGSFWEQLLSNGVLHLRQACKDECCTSAVRTIVSNRQGDRLC